MQTRKILPTVIFSLLAVSVSACGHSSSISVVSREDGSGTRGAFTELTGLIDHVDGKKVDMTTPASEITNSTSVVISTVMSNPQAIGYISLGSLNNDVKALAIDGVIPSQENIKNGTYKLSRPFNLVINDAYIKNNQAAEVFIQYILSPCGQQVVSENGYVPLEAKGECPKGGISGRITVAGSSSVTPVMEKLAEDFRKTSPDTVIEVQQSDSTTGITSSIQKISDIGMSSRDLTSDELSKGVRSEVIARDGIAVIVNKANAIQGLSKTLLNEIYRGKITEWPNKENK